MRKNFTFFLLFLLTSLSFAQFSTYASYQWGELDTLPCPSDSNTTVITLKHCQIYQTVDDTWNGAKDTTVCLNVITLNNYAYIKLLGANPAKKIFVHWNLPDSLKLPLLENAVGEFSLYFSADTAVNLNISPTCNSNCTSVSVGIEIPDENNLGHNTRWYELPLTANTWQGVTGYGGNSCIPTERFANGNFLKEILFTFSFQNTSFVGCYLRLGGFNYELSPAVTQWWSSPSGTWATPVTDTTVYVNGNQHHHTRVLSDIYYTGSPYGIFLFMYEDSTYPAPNNFSFVEYNLSPNPITQDTLDLSIAMNETFVFQPFTAIRGGFAQGDSLRHIVNLYNNGAQLCIPGWVDVQILPKAAYIHQAGGIDFQDNSACMMLHTQAFLKVAEKGYLHYGNEGRGMLGVQTAARIIVEKGATLVFDGKMVLIPLPSDTARHDMEITLLPNSLLRFTENSTLINKCLAGFGRKIKVYMKGGFLDISNLSPTEQKYFEYVYDEKPKYMEDNILILGNPMNETLNWQYIDDKPSELILTFINLEGKFVDSYHVATQKGINVFEQSVEHLPPGFYFLSFESTKGNIIRRIWKQ